VALGQTVSGTIADVGEWHRYVFTVPAGQIVFLDGLGRSEEGRVGKLRRPGGGENGFGLTCRDIGRRVLDEAGQWTVEIYSDTLATGAYSFKITASE